MNTEPAKEPMMSQPKLELAHTLISEEEALRLLEGHRISLGNRTMDPKAQVVGEFVKSIRQPGVYPPLPELRQQLRTMVALMDEPAPKLARIEDITIPGPAGAIPARVYSDVGPRASTIGSRPSTGSPRRSTTASRRTR